MGSHSFSLSGCLDEGGGGKFQKRGKNNGYVLDFTFLLAAFGIRRPPVAPSFVARRKIGEKGVPRRRKLRILRFAFRGKSSVVPLLLLSPPNPLRWALAGPLLAAPLNPQGLMV